MSNYFDWRKQPSSEKRLKGLPPDGVHGEDEAVHEERMAQRLLTPEERAAIKSMMQRAATSNSGQPRKLICFGTGNQY